MNFSDLKLRAAQLAAIEGADKVQPQPNWAKLVNEALYRWSWEAEYQTASYSFTTTAGQSEYVLPTPPDWKRVTDAVLGGNTALVLTDEPTLRRQNPEWTVAPSDTPTQFFLTRPNTIRLFPTPSVSGVTVAVRGIRADTALVNDTDSPAVPDHQAEGIALLAAWLWTKQFAAGDDIPRVAAYHDEAMSLANDCRLYLAEQASPNFQRTVRPAIPDRVSLGWYRSYN